MTISELIELLNKIKKEHGDLDIYFEAQDKDGYIISDPLWEENVKIMGNCNSGIYEYLEIS